MCFSMERETLNVNELRQQIQFQVSLLNLVQRDLVQTGNGQSPAAAPRIVELYQALPH